MTYTEFVQAITILAAQASAQNGYTLPTDFTNLLPRVIEYAEDRIYREMVFLATRAADASLTFSGSTRSLNLQSMTTIIIVPEGLAAISPVATIPALGTRLPFLQASLDVIDISWPTESATRSPALVQPEQRMWAMKDAETIVVCPTPNAAFVAEITGLFRPLQLSATNTTTYITLSYPDLMIAAGMIFMTGYMRNFGAQSDNPQMSASWEDQYKKLAASATLEEQRRRGSGTGWSNNAPTPLAAPARK